VKNTEFTVPFLQGKERSFSSLKQQCKGSLIMLILFFKKELKRGDKNLIAKSNRNSRFILPAVHVLLQLFEVRNNGY